jgi:hypothetical protein
MLRVGETRTTHLAAATATGAATDVGGDRNRRDACIRYDNLKRDVSKPPAHDRAQSARVRE